MKKRARQYIGIFTAVAAYYLVHEGTHLITALFFGVFKKINVLGLGIQIDVYAGRMTDAQLGIFCLSGAAATFAAGWLLIFLTNRVCARQSKVFKAAMWYVSLALLMVDPIYLSVLCGLFGGGDMNGIGLLIPETAARVLFAGIGTLHGVIVWKYLLPKYTLAFQEG